MSSFFQDSRILSDLQNSPPISEALGLSWWEGFLREGMGKSHMYGQKPKLAYTQRKSRDTDIHTCIHTYMNIKCIHIRKPGEGGGGALICSTWLTFALL